MVGGVLEIHVRICVKMPLNRNHRSISSFSLLLYSLLVLEHVLLFFDKKSLQHAIQISPLPSHLAIVLCCNVQFQTQ